MQIPATAMTSNLMWTRSGVVWATWRLQPLPYAYATAAAKVLSPTSSSQAMKPTVM